MNSRELKRLYFNTVSWATTLFLEGRHRESSAAFARANDIALKIKEIHPDWEP